jgi:hypothetical protein
MIFSTRSRLRFCRGLFVVIPESPAARLSVGTAQNIKPNPIPLFLYSDPAVTSQGCAATVVSKTKFFFLGEKCTSID